jgi:hypothetical protein
MISLATSVTFMATSFALAQDPDGHSHSRAESDAIEQQFLFDNDLAISNMNRAMLAKPTGDVDHDFVDVMIPHHHDDRRDRPRGRLPDAGPLHDRIQALCHAAPVARDPAISDIRKDRGRNSLELRTTLGNPS